MDISDANIIDCFKKWVKLVKPNRNTVASAVDSLMSRWTTAMIGEIRDPGTNVFRKIHNLHDIVDRITKWGMDIDTVTRASKTLGIYHDPKDHKSDQRNTTSLSTSEPNHSKNIKTDDKSHRAIKSNSLKMKNGPCNHCGKLHGGDPNSCVARLHPNHNPDSKIPWSDSKMGKAWASLEKPLSSIGLKYMINDDKRTTRDLTAETWSKIKSRLDEKKGVGNNKYAPKDKHKGTMPLLTSFNITIPCCSHHDEYIHAERIKIKAWIGNQGTNILTHLLIDPGCLQANLIRKDIALKLQKQGAIFETTSNEVMSGIGSNRRRVKITHQVRFRLAFDAMQFVNNSVNNRYFDLIALIIDVGDFPLILGLPTIQNYKLLTVLSSHLESFPQLCEMCTDTPKALMDNDSLPPAKKIRSLLSEPVKPFSTEDVNSRVGINPELVSKPAAIVKAKRKLSPKTASERSLIKHDQTNNKLVNNKVDSERVILLNYINSITDTSVINTTDISMDELTEMADRVHISDVFNYEEDNDEIPDDDVTDIIDKDVDVLSLLQIEGDDLLRADLREICSKYKDIFSTTVKSTPADVPPLKFGFDAELWQKTANRMPPRRLSQEKQVALSVIIDELLAFGVIRPSKATAWSQVMLVPKSTGGWRLTIDYRQLNHVVENQGWQIPNMSQMLTRIGSKKPVFFGSADLTSGYYKMPLAEECHPITAFITFRGIYEWTRVPMGLLPSANYFQRTMTEHVLHGLVYTACEVYIDDLLMSASERAAYLQNIVDVFQRLREKNVTLNPKKVKLGLNKIQFVGHEIDHEGLNMSKERIENTVDIKQPQNLKELYSFVGVCNYFRDHIKDHSDTSRPLHSIIAKAVKLRSKLIEWTDEGIASFYKLKDQVNECPKLYYIDDKMDVYLCTDASDYAIGAYLYQLSSENKEFPIRFLSKSLNSIQQRWSTIEKEAFAIYHSLTKMEDLLGGVKFTIKTDHKNLLFLSQAGSNKVLNWKLAIQHFDFHIIHIPGKDNIIADAFSRLVNRPPVIKCNVIMTPTYTDAQYEVMNEYHTRHSAHWGVERTITNMKFYRPDVCEDWPTLRQDVREYVQSCPCCQKMSQILPVIAATRFVLSSQAPMMKVDMDTIGPLPEDINGNKHIIVIIDTFTRYVNMYPVKDVSAISAARAFHEHSCRFGYPKMITTDNGSQFMNELFKQLTLLEGIKHINTVPYSKEENGMVERANKEVNRHLRNLIFDRNILKEWSDFIPLIMKNMNSSVKMALGTSPNTLLFGNMIDVNSSSMPELEAVTLTTTSPKTTLRDYVDKLMNRQSLLIDAAIRSQNLINSENIEKRYKKYTCKDMPRIDKKVAEILRAPKGKKASKIVKLNNLIGEMNAYNKDNKIINVNAIRAWRKDDASEPTHWVPTTLDTAQEAVASVDDKPQGNADEQVGTHDFNLAQFMLRTTRFQVDDYVLRRYPPSKVASGPPSKYLAYWKGPYRVIGVLSSNVYEIQNLVSMVVSKAHVKQLKNFYYDPKRTIPINVAVKDTDEFVVGDILEHELNSDGDMMWKVRWDGFEESDDTWEPLYNLVNVVKFQEYCRWLPSLKKYLPRDCRGNPKK